MLVVVVTNVEAGLSSAGEWSGYGRGSILAEFETEKETFRGGEDSGTDGGVVEVARSNESKDCLDLIPAFKEYVCGSFGEATGALRIKSPG